MTNCLKKAFALSAVLLLAFTRTYAAESLYVDPDSVAAAWVREHPNDPRASEITKRIANVPSARWFGDWDSNVGVAVRKFVSEANSAQRIPLLVAYNIPNRDCKGASAGGAPNELAYRSWIDDFAKGIGEKAAIVVVEPDALAQISCLDADNRKARFDLLRYALSSLRMHAPIADVYLDAGNPHWISADEISSRLELAGLRQAKGFALNISNFYPSQESVEYAAAINSELIKAFGYRKATIIDTSRNGNGSIGQWCNPAGAKLGDVPKLVSREMIFGWVKNPGQSDGPCGTGASTRAGVFSPDLVMRLIQGN